MNQGETVFAQLLQFVLFSHFEHLVDVYQAKKGGEGVLRLESFHLPGLRAGPGCAIWWNTCTLN